MKRLRSVSILFAVAVVGVGLASAQDNQYWSNQYGTRSALLGGAVVGGVRDTSAAFYNPGALGFIENKSLSVSANALKFDQLEIDQGAGTEDSLDSDEINIIPLLISGVYMFESMPNHVFGYSLLTHNQHRVKASDRRDEVIDVLSNPLAPGLEDYIGQFTFDSDLTEVWGGLSWAYRPWQDVSIGLTNFFALRNQSQSQTILARAVNQELFTVGATDGTASIDYTNLRVLWKFGAAADLDPVKIGMTITTPSVSLYGDGTVARDVTVANVDFSGDGNPDSFVADDRQDGLDAEYRSPISVAWGIEYALSSETSLAATAEYFGKQSGYSVITPESRDFLRPTGLNLFDSRDFLRVTDEADSVFNWALGMEQALSDKVKGIISFRSDYSSYKTSGDQSASVGFTNWDIYHATVGATYKKEHSEWGLGLVYSFGQKDGFEQPVNLSNPSEANFLLGDVHEVSVDYRAISAIFGYTYFFE